MTEFATYVSSPSGWAALFFCALLIGAAKTGIQGLGTLVVPILAIAVGSKPSTGLLLPMLCIADLMAVIYYRRNAQWKYIARLLPATFVGFGVALAVDGLIPPSEFKRLMAICIMIGIGVMFWKSDSKVTSAWWFAPMFGLLGGFTTMIGNAAGPIMAVYLLSMRLPKYAFVGTSAWFFMIVNYTKLPVQIWAWHNITWASITLNFITLPFIAIGACLGILLVKRLPENSYRGLIIVLTIISTLLLFI